MKLLIHCDEVFDILTRGPFPSGHESDAAVEHHLRCCHDCRQLAEALRPAVELFHECLSDEETRKLPEYHGQVTPLPLGTSPLGTSPLGEPLRRLPRTLAEVQLPAEQTPRHGARLQRWALLLHGVVGMAMTAAVVLLVINMGHSMRDLRQPAQGSGSRNSNGLPALVSSAEAARQLLSLQLPAACWLGQDFPLRREHADAASSFERQLAAALERHEILCCTRCHSESNSATPTMTQFATLQKSCLACHKG